MLKRSKQHLDASALFRVPSFSLSETNRERKARGDVYRRYGKRLFDLLASTSAAAILSPILVLVALMIRLEDGGPALFIQERVGKDGKRFRLMKFRSMAVNTADVPSAEGQNLKVTRVGRLIRRTNIDELPQLLNIVKGDMSVVGPRPALPGQKELLAMRSESDAMSCKPGLTGVAQVNAYDGMPESEKAHWDGLYAQRVTFVRDMLTIARTVLYLFHRPPVY